MRKLTLILFILSVALKTFAQVVIVDSTGKAYTIPAGTYRQVAAPPTLPPALPDCGCSKPDWSILSVTKKAGDTYVVQYNSCNVNPFEWAVTKAAVPIKSGSVVPTSSTIEINLPGLTAGEYTITATSPKCKGSATAKFRIASISGERTDALVSLSDPLAPTTQLSGNYEIRYIESREDDHLRLRITEANGEILLTEHGNSLRSATIVLNGWVPEEPGKLENEVIRPYTRYHISKWSVDAGTLGEWWKALYETPKRNYRRSEVFFYVVPKGETWNPDGESPNPIGRPAAFAKVPAFKLKNRTYGFEYDLLDESGARLDDLDIIFNRKKGQRHLKLYSSVLSQWIRSRGINRGLHDLTEKECIDWANSIALDKILAFDIEPSEDSQWIIDYDAPNFVRNMDIVLTQLQKRGALAYNWMEAPARSPNVLTLDGVKFGPGGSYGKDLAKFGEMYKRVSDVQRRNNTNALISTGYGYNAYDCNEMSQQPVGNISPQYTYLRSLDVAELWSRVWPEKNQVYFSWPFIEFDVVTFPQNHVVEIPEFGARARRTDNKPLYPPNHWEDNLTLALTNPNVTNLFYWSPGPVSWNPAGTSSYNNAYTSGFSVWTFEEGRAPETGKFYIGKESMALNATIKAAYNFSRVQDAADGVRYAPSFTWQRATKNGGTESATQVEAITDGSWYNQALVKRQPFALVLVNNGKKALFFQDVWARPGRFTEFTVVVDGVEYRGKTEGNRLFTAVLQ